MARLTRERDEAVKARDAMVQRVLPLAMPKPERSSSSSKAIMLLLLFLLAGAILMLMVAFPKMANRAGAGGGLPAGVEVRERGTGLPAGVEVRERETELPLDD